MCKLFGILGQYKDVFGKAKQGCMGSDGIVDYMMTIIFAIVVSYYTKVPLVLVTIFMFILGIAMHYINSIQFIQKIFKNE